MGRVAVIHPDLGVGGAERLIIDASRALQESGHEVTIYTGYHNKERCFKETRDGTINTLPVGQWIPRTILGKFHALMAYLKMIYIAFYILLFTKSNDIILCDQVSACIPFLKLDSFRNRKLKIVFYCHFPDQLLTQRDSLIKAIYRKPIDKFEEWSTSLADIILVNSKFTKNVVQRTFPKLCKRELLILYPCVDVSGFIQHKPSKKDCENLYHDYQKINKDQFVFLSLNRFERKKELTKALEALSDLLFKLRNDERLSLTKNSTKNDVHLIIAGGYDPRLGDSVAYRNELLELAHQLDISDHVTFIESPTDSAKLMLLQICDTVIYTPENEHFGIVPLEAMAMSKPVVASASGGPLETISDGENGFLCSRDNESSFSEAMIRLYTNQGRSIEMGRRGFEKVKKHFSYEAFRKNLNVICFPQSNSSKRG